MRQKIFYGKNTNVYPGIIARNNAVLEYEKFIHRTFFPYIIHPHSQFRVTWQKVEVVFIPVRLIIVSLLWATLPHGFLFFQIILLLSHIINCVDVIMNFFTGYIEHKTEIVILDPRRIARRYLTTYFVLDLLPCIPFELIYMFCRGTGSRMVYDISEILLDILNHLIYLRFFTFLRYYHNLAKLMLWNIFLIDLVSVIFAIIIIFFIALDMNKILLVVDGRNLPKNHSTTLSQNTGFWNDTIDNMGAYFDDIMYLILDCLYHETKLLTNPYVRCFVLISFFFCDIIFITYFIKYVLLKLLPKDRFLDLESRVLTFVRMRHLSRTLEFKSLLYFQIILENKAYREDELFNFIPDTFKADIFFQLCLPLLKHFYPFNDLPTYVLRRLAECMSYQLHLPNELVLKKDDTKLSMYFIHRGTVALYSSKHVELYHFEGGSSFNGRNLILGEPANGCYAISIEVTEVYRLNRHDFLEIMKSYPALFAEVEQKVLKEKTGGNYIV